MAYVAKSQKVWSLIEQNINRLFTDRINHADEWASYVNPKTFAEMCYSSIITPEHEELIKQLPSNFLPPRKEFIFKINVKKPAIWGFKDDTHPEDYSNLDAFNEAYNAREKVELEQEKKISASFDAEFEPKRAFPGDWNHYRDEDHKIKSSAVKQEIADIVIRRYDQKRAVTKERENMIKNAKNLYEKAKSINQFVKLWEPALSLLDSEIHERLRRKVERSNSAASQNITEEELASLNSSFVKAKVSQ
jgi:hypothetical protein